MKKIKNKVFWFSVLSPVLFIVACNSKVVEKPIENIEPINSSNLSPSQKVIAQSNLDDFLKKVQKDISNYKQLVNLMKSRLEGGSVNGFTVFDLIHEMNTELKNKPLQQYEDNLFLKGEYLLPEQLASNFHESDPCRKINHIVSVQKNERMYILDYQIKSCMTENKYITILSIRNDIENNQFEYSFNNENIKNILPLRGLSKDFKCEFLNNNQGVKKCNSMYIGENEKNIYTASYFHSEYVTQEERIKNVLPEKFYYFSEIVSVDKETQQIVYRLRISLDKNANIIETSYLNGKDNKNTSLINEVSQ